MQLIPGKLYKTKTDLWFKGRWIEKDSIFCLVKTKKIISSVISGWAEYTFLYKTEYCVTESKNGMVELLAECN